jgi:hypothetical protein
MQYENERGTVHVVRFFFILDQAYSAKNHKSASFASLRRQVRLLREFKDECILSLTSHPILKLFLDKYKHSHNFNPVEPILSISFVQKSNKMIECVLNENLYF